MDTQNDGLEKVDSLQTIIVGIYVRFLGCNPYMEPLAMERMHYITSSTSKGNGIHALTSSTSKGNGIPALPNCILDQQLQVQSTYFETYVLVKLDHFPKGRVFFPKMFGTTTQVRV